MDGPIWAEDLAYLDLLNENKDGITSDVEVYQTYEDYLNGIDSIYEKIISD